MTTVAEINKAIANGNAWGTIQTESISDTYHTFGELYEHRISLWIALCKAWLDASEWQNDRYFDKPVVKPWRTKAHSDGSVWEGWFILGYGRGSGEQMTYHLPMSKWDECDFAETLDKAPEWDGHTSGDVLNRIKGI